MNAFTLPGFDLSAFVHATLAEDLGEGLPGGGHDVTCESVVPANARFAGVMGSREAITVAGLPLAAAFFRHLDPVCTIEMFVQDGQSVTPGTALMRIAGNARALLTAERSALNTVQHLTGIATMTRPVEVAPMKRLSPNSPHDVPVRKAQGEGCLDAGSSPGPCRCLGLHRRREPSRGRPNG